MRRVGQAGGDKLESVYSTVVQKLHGVGMRMPRALKSLHS